MGPQKSGASYLFYSLSWILSLLLSVGFVSSALSDSLSDMNPGFNCPPNPSFIAAAGPTQICKDTDADWISFTTTESGAATFVYVLTDDADTILQVMPSGTLDFNQLNSATYRVYGVAFIGILNAPVGSHVDQIGATVCHVRSANAVSVEVIELKVGFDILSDYNGYPISVAGGSDGEVEVIASGGVGAYTYIWDTQPAQAGKYASDLAAGSYEVSVEDEQGCRSDARVDLIEPEPLQLSLGPINNFGEFGVQCADDTDGALVASPSGGVLPYSFVWPGFVDSDSVLSDLGPGVYQVIVSDANGAQQSMVYDLQMPSPIELNVSSQYPSCYGEENGEITTSISGGVRPYSYAWNGEAGDSLASHLGAGTYLLQVTDKLGCVEEKIVELTAPDSLMLTVVAEAPSCNGTDDGWIAVEATGGTAPYQFLWNDGSQTSSRFDLSSGSYQLQVLDANNCEASIQETLTEAEPIEWKAEVIPDDGTGSGAINLLLNQGADPVSIIWSTGDSTAYVEGLSIGTYAVKMQRADGCEVMGNIEVPATDRLECLEVHTGFTPNGDGVNETWHIPCIDWFPENEVSIYNRWGQLIYEAISYQNDWDGTINGRPLPDGTYFYTLQLRSIDDRRLLKGTVTILR